MFLLLLLIGSTISQDVITSYQQVDSEIESTVWCGAAVVMTKDDEVVEQTHDETRRVLFVLTDSGKVWKSNNYGKTWESLQQQFEKEADNRLFFESVQISPADSRVIYFFSAQGRSFKSKDCGRTYTMFSHQSEFYDFKLNKMDERWIMSFKDKPCGKNDINCHEGYKKGIYITEDGGTVWLPVLNYVKAATWDKLLEYQMVPDQRIIVCHMKDGKSVVSYSDDYFKTTQVISEEAIGFFQSQYYVFVLNQPTEKNGGFGLQISPAYLDQFTPQDIKLPIQSLEQHTYTVLDTTEGQIFLSVSHNEENQKLTNIYVSDYRGFRFSLSLLHNVRSLDTGNCDFERILGVEGVYIANVFDHSEVEKLKGRENPNIKLLDQYRKTFISYDKGGNWHPLKAPSCDADGNEIICSGDCSLHLRGRTDASSTSIYSSENSVGLALGVGNTGMYLSQKDSEINTYLTRDGGHTWFEIRKGSHLYEIGDRGGIIVMARDDIAVRSIIYSWDEGLTWQEIEVSEKAFMVVNILTEPTNMELKFIVHGTYLNEEQNIVGVIIALNFQNLHQRVCSGSWDPTMPESDYEFWIPRNYEMGKCTFGRKLKYIRRKREAQCFNQEEMDKKFFIESCPCVDDDWECDYGFFRQIEGGPCIPIADKFEEDDIPDVLKPPQDCKGTYMKTQGYRKVSGDYCNGGVDLGPIRTECPNATVSASEEDQQEPPIPQKYPYQQNQLEEQDQTENKNQRQVQNHNLLVVAIGSLLVLLAWLSRQPLINYLKERKQQQKQKKPVIERKNYEQMSLFRDEDEP